MRGSLETESHERAVHLDEPPRLLAATLARAGIAPGRFRTLEVGRPWEIPLLAAR